MQEHQDLVGSFFDGNTRTTLAYPGRKIVLIDDSDLFGDNFHRFFDDSKMLASI